MQPIGDNPIQERTFPFRLAAWLPACYEMYLHWLRKLLDRLGREGALRLWELAFHDQADEYLEKILGSGWEECSPAGENDIDAQIARLIHSVFAEGVESVSGAEAKQLVELAHPLVQIRHVIPSMHVCKQMTAYEALHVKFEGRARLAEGLISRFGKQGELIAYDIVVEERVRSAGGRTGSMAEFLADMTGEPVEHNLFTAGLTFDLLSSASQEIVMRVRECEWARYFRERHPQVGYLLACSTDEAAYRAFNQLLRLQRTTTLMEGGQECDFRIYCAGC